MSKSQSQLATNSLRVISRHSILEKDFSIYGTFENPLFLVKDVANWLEHTNTTHLLNNVDPEEKLNLKLLNSGQKRDFLFLTEFGLYEVLMQSRKPIAKAFKKEVKRILKELRLNGTLQTAPPPEPTALPEPLAISEKELIAAELLIRLLKKQYPSPTEFKEDYLLLEEILRPKERYQGMLFDMLSLNVNYRY